MNTLTIVVLIACATMAYASAIPDENPKAEGLNVAAPQEIFQAEESRGGYGYGHGHGGRGHGHGGYRGGHGGGHHGGYHGGYQGGHHGGGGRGYGGGRYH